MARPHADHARPPIGNAPPKPRRGQALRTMTPLAAEDRDEAMARAQREKPWGARIVGHAWRTSASSWTFLIVETDTERAVRLRALAERRAAGGAK